MARNKSAFDLMDGLFSNGRATSDNHPVAPQNETVRVTAADTRPASPASPASSAGTILGSTQGRKGQKLQRINMAFGTDVHDYIRFESRRRGMSITEFVNFVLGEYMNGPDGHIG